MILSRVSGRFRRGPREDDGVGAAHGRHVRADIFLDVVVENIERQLCPLIALGQRQLEVAESEEMPDTPRTPESLFNISRI